MSKLNTKIEAIDRDRFTTVLGRALIEVTSHTGTFVLILVIATLHFDKAILLADIKLSFVNAIYLFNAAMAVICCYHKIQNMANGFDAVPLLYNRLIHRIVWYLILPVVINEYIQV